ncbi:MAG: DUF6502 family protein [Nitrospinota bacterium]
MQKDGKAVFTETIIKVLRPLTKILLRNGISFKEFSELARWVYVSVAGNEFQIEGKKQSKSRISVITGLSRKEVQKLKNRDISELIEGSEYNRAARVINGWVHDKRFSVKGAPRVLNLEEEPNKKELSFKSLIKIFSGDMPFRAVLDELKNVGAVRIVKDDKVELIVRAYIPVGDEEAMVKILGNDVSDLISTVNNNIEHKNEKPFFQRTLSYDNVPLESVPVFQEFSSKEAQTLLEKLNAWLMDHDRDSNPDVKGTGRKRIGLGVYYFEEDSPNS